MTKPQEVKEAIEFATRSHKALKKSFDKISPSFMGSEKSKRMLIEDIGGIQTLISLAQKVMDINESGVLPEEKKIEDFCYDCPPSEQMDCGDCNKDDNRLKNLGHNACREEMLLRLASPKLGEEIAEVIWGNATNTPRLTQAGVNEFTQAITNYLRGEK